MAIPLFSNINPFVAPTGRVRTGPESMFLVGVVDVARRSSRHHNVWAMAEFARRRATYEDVLNAPPHQVAQVLDGELHLHPRPAPVHALAAAALGMELGNPFQRGRGGPGGWWIFDESELHLGPGPDILVPDLGGWRMERMPQIPTTAYFTLPPDWVCEILSESTRRIDRGPKMRICARERVPHVWLVDPIAQTLEVFRLDGATYRFIASYEGEVTAAVEPFDVIELQLAALWRNRA
jgi:Uma2 family endonuclease